jgi:hypothetical protein
MSLFGGKSNSSANSRILGYRVSTSIAGSALKIVFGTNRVAGNVIWTGDWKAQKADGKAGKGKYGGNYNYTTAAIVGLCSGPIEGIVAVWQDQVQNGQTDTSWLNATSAADLGLTVVLGNIGQAAWSYVTTNHPEQALGYSQIAYVGKQDWELGTSGVMPNYSYEVAGFDIFGGSSDALCSDIITRLLTDQYIGAGLDVSEVDVTGIEDYCKANGIFISPVLDQQKPAAAWVDELLLIANGEAVWSEGVLKMISRGDTAATGNGATFTPDFSPVYDLNDDDFKDRTEPVIISRPDPRDAYNSVKVNWTNRQNQYNTEPMEEFDQSMIDTYGARPAAAIDALGITTADVAAKVSNVQLKKNIYFRTGYKFRLGWEHILLEPMDVVTLTCQVGSTIYQRLDHTPVRVLSIEEDEDGTLSCEAEEMPAGAGNPVLHPKEVSGGFSAPLNADPGDVNAPVFYEASPAMKQLMGVPYSLLIALSGGPYWGGCTVHRSFDGTTYEVVGRQIGATPMGVLTANLATGSDPDTTHTASVNLLESFGKLDSIIQGTTALNNFKTLFLVGSELMSFQTATLTSKYNYDLTTLRRGVYGSAIASHLSGDAWALMDNRRAFEWDYQSQDVHKTVYFKFTSFNQYGNAEQSLADVTEYTFTLTGGLSAHKVVTSDYTLQPADVGIDVDTTAGPVTITLPAATSTVNTNVTITKISSDSNAVTITGSSISGAATTILTAPFQFITIESSPSGWILVSSGTGQVDVAQFMIFEKVVAGSDFTEILVSLNQDLTECVAEARVMASPADYIFDIRKNGTSIFGVTKMVIPAGDTTKQTQLVFASSPLHLVKDDKLTGHLLQGDGLAEIEVFLRGRGV